MLQSKESEPATEESNSADDSWETSDEEEVRASISSKIGFIL